MQVLEDFLVGAQHTRLIIGNSMLMAEGFDEALGFSQIRAGHTWKQVMLDLVVQSPVPKVCNGMGFHIASCHYLAVQEAHIALLV